MNLRPPGYEPDELPSCSTPRHSVAFIGDIDYYTLFQRFCQEGAESFFAAEAEDENAAADLLSRKPAATPIHAPPRGATGIKNMLEDVDPFQFTPLREGRRRGADRGIHMGFYFNSRPSARGDKDWSPPLARWINFNSRPSARGDDAQGNFIAEVIAFQFTPLREGRHHFRNFRRKKTYFNSRPSARGDAERDYFSTFVHISIHAPPRGATTPRRRAEAA